MGSGKLGWLNKSKSSSSSSGSDSSSSYLGFVVGSLHGIVVKYTLSDTTVAVDEKVDVDPRARVPDLRAGGGLGLSLVDGTLAERALGVLRGVGDVDDAARGRRVGARQDVLAHDDRSAGSQRSDGEDHHGADETAGGAVPVVAPLDGRLRAEIVQRVYGLVHLHRRNHDDDDDEASRRMNAPTRDLNNTELLYSGIPLQPQVSK